MELVENEIDTHVPVGVGSAELKRARPRKYSSVMFSKGESLKTTGYPHNGYHDSVSGASDNSRRGGLRSGLQAPETPRSARFERACQTPDGADMKR